MRALDPGRLDACGEAEEQQQVEQPDPGVYDQQRPVGAGACEAEAGEERDYTREQGACGSGQVAQRVVDREHPGPALVRRGLGQDRLLDGDEWANFGAARADGAGEGAQHQHPELVGEGEDEAAGDHQDGHGGDGPSPAEAVCGERPEDVHQGGASHCRGQDDSDLKGAQPELLEVEPERHREVAVAERAQRPAGEQLPAVRVQPGQGHGG